MSKNIDLPVGRKALLCLRHEQLRLSLLPPESFENGLVGRLRRTLYEGNITNYEVELAEGIFVNVSHNNYLAHMGREFYELDEDYHIIWSKTSGEIIHDEQD